MCLEYVNRTRSELSTATRRTTASSRPLALTRRRWNSAVPPSIRPRVPSRRLSRHLCHAVPTRPKKRAPYQYRSCRRTRSLAFASMLRQVRTTIATPSALSLPCSVHICAIPMQQVYRFSHVCQPPGPCCQASLSVDHAPHIHHIHLPRAFVGGVYADLGAVAVPPRVQVAADRAL